MTAEPNRPSRTPNRRSFLRILGAAPLAGLVLGYGDELTAATALQQPGESDLACTLTGRDIEGPFFVPGAPRRAVLAALEEPGERVFIGGRVLRADGCTPVAGVLLDIWHADVTGRYHNASEDYRLRGQILTDAEGRYALETIRPGHYLNGPAYRPAHIHFTVSKPGLAPLTTQLYFAGDPYLQPNDSCGFCSSGDATLIIELREKLDQPGAREGTFDIVLAPV